MKVLLAYDGSENSRPALEEVARIAREGDVTVTALSVVPTDEAPSRFGTGPRPHAQDDAAEAHSYLRERGIECEMKVEEGVPAEEILKEARAGGYDMIVTGTRGRGPVARLLMGSVSHKVTDGAPCTVIVVGEEHHVRVEPQGKNK